jgi:putative addiction module component (TIGR02574 family)
MTVRALIKEAEKLSRDEQVELLDELLCLVGAEEADVALTPAQADDLERRMVEARAGKDKRIPGDEAMAQLRKRS